MTPAGRDGRCPGHDLRVQWDLGTKAQKNREEPGVQPEGPPPPTSETPSCAPQTSLWSAQHLHPCTQPVGRFLGEPPLPLVALMTSLDPQTRCRETVFLFRCSTLGSKETSPPFRRPPGLFLESSHWAWKRPTQSQVYPKLKTLLEAFLRLSFPRD